MKERDEGRLKPMVNRLDTIEVENSLFLPEGRFKRVILVICLFILAFSVRLFYIGTVEFSPLRQHHSAIIARAMYRLQFQSFQ